MHARGYLRHASGCQDTDQLVEVWIITLIQSSDIGEKLQLVLEKEYKKGYLTRKRILKAEIWTFTQVLCNVLVPQRGRVNQLRLLMT